MQISGLLPPGMADGAVVRYSDEGYLRVWIGDIPFGPRIQTDGPRCRPWRHRWFIDKYERIAGQFYRDKVCEVCHRRIPLK